MTQLSGGGLAQQRSNKIVLIRGRNTPPCSSRDYYVSYISWRNTINVFNKTFIDRLELHTFVRFQGWFCRFSRATLEHLIVLTKFLSATFPCHVSTWWFYFQWYEWWWQMMMVQFCWPASSCISILLFPFDAQSDFNIMTSHLQLIIKFIHRYCAAAVCCLW